MEPNEYNLIRAVSGKVYWGWYVFWLIIFPPMILITLIIHYNKGVNYEVMLFSTEGITTKTFTEEEYVTIVSTMTERK